MDNKVKNRALISGGIALVITAVFFACCLLIPELSKKVSSIGNINIMSYGLALILFCVCFLLCQMIMTKFDMGALIFLETEKAKKITLFVFLAVMAIMAIMIVELETDMLAGVAYKYAWHTQPYVFAIAFFVIEMLAFLWLYAKLDARGKELNWFVWGIYVLLIALVLYAMYTPNIFGRGEWGDWYHAHAYFNSIYNVYWGMPYTDEVTSIYGHYALFWKLPMELIKGDFRKFIFLMAVLGAFTHACAFGTLKKTVNSRMLQIIGALALVFPILGMRGGYYWQVWPHRMLFPAIMLIYAVYVLSKDKLNWITTAFGYGICVLAVVWNTETGMILAIAWAALHVSRIFSQPDFTWKKLIGTVVYNGAGVVVSFFGAYGIVNVYNIMKHSPANTIAEFLIPLLTKQYMNNVLQLDMPLYPSAYMAEIILFFIGVVIGICDWKWFRKEKEMSWKNQFIFFLSISALGRFVYFMNRPAYHNMDCCHFSAVILLVFLAEKVLGFIKHQEWKHLEKFAFHRVIKHGISIVCLMVVLAMGTGTILQFGENSYIKSNFHNDEELDNFVQTVAAYIPENTFGFGMNVAEIYSWLGRSTQYFGMDFSDLSVAPQGVQTLINTLKDQNIEYLFTSQKSIDILKIHSEEAYEWFLDTYEIDAEFPISTEEFYYMTKK